MTRPNWSRLSLCVLIVGFLASNAAWASDREDHGFVWYESLQGSVNSIGLVNRLDTTVGYSFNRFVEFNVGVPVYFVRPSKTVAQDSGSDSFAGLGNAYANLQLTFANPTWRFTSVVTGRAVNGDRAKGLSTGRGGVDWTNTVSRYFHSASPYVSVGIANTVSDTSFFVRPFSSVGFVAHVEAGSTFRLNDFNSVGMSAYKIIPSGGQTIISRVVPRETVVTVETAGAPSPPGRGNGLALGRGSGGSETITVQTFETVSETVGDASLAKDHGLSAWWSINPSTAASFYAGFSRSFPYKLNTFFFGTTVNVSYLIRRAAHD